MIKSPPYRTGLERGDSCNPSDFFQTNADTKMMHTITARWRSRLLSPFRRARDVFMDPHKRVSYSQEGEDMVLSRFFEGKKTGCYVDVGAHHPRRFSNTFLFYKMGWTGINIDAMPGSMRPFRATRPKDTNLEIPISDQRQKLTYYAFQEPALNGFSKEVSERRTGSQGCVLKFTKELETYPLKEVLARHLPAATEIDFLSVDVEGLDLQVLKSNDWELYRPEMVLVETLGDSIEDINKGEISLLMKSVGYTFYAKTCKTCFFHRKR